MVITDQSIGVSQLLEARAWDAPQSLCLPVCNFINTNECIDNK